MCSIWTISASPTLTKNDKRLEGGAGRNPTDVWYFDRVNNMTKKHLQLTHPTVYPLPMILRILKMSSDPGGHGPRSLRGQRYHPGGGQPAGDAAASALSWTSSTPMSYTYIYSGRAVRR